MRRRHLTFQFSVFSLYANAYKRIGLPDGQPYSYLIGVYPNAILTSAYGSRLVVLECCLV